MTIAEMTDQEWEAYKAESKARLKAKKRIARLKLQDNLIGMAQSHCRQAVKLSKPALLPDMFPGVTREIEKLFGPAKPKIYKSSKGDSVEWQCAISIRILIDMMNDPRYIKE